MAPRAISSRFTDVLTVFDTEGIRATYSNPSKDPNSPTFCDHKFIFMVTTKDQAITGQGGAELDVKAGIGDVIRWRESNLSLGFEDSVIFYRFLATGGKDLISNPVPLVATVTVPVPNPADPLHPNRQQIQNYFWNSTILSAGRVTYHFYFYVLNRDSTVYGCFQWDPFITISN